MPVPVPVRKHSDLSRLARTQSRLILSKDQIPNNQPRTQSHSPPKHSLRRTPPLSSPLQLLISAPNIRSRRIRITNKLRNILFLRSQMRNKRILQRRNLNQGLFRIPKQNTHH